LRFDSKTEACSPQVKFIRATICRTLLARTTVPVVGQTAGDVKHLKPKKFKLKVELFITEKLYIYYLTLLLTKNIS